MNIIFIVLSSILTLASALPYIRDTIKGQTKPRIVSWITWSLLTGISAAAAFTDHQLATGILLSLATVETLAIALLGWKHGDRALARFDIVCLGGVLVGLVLWLIFSSPKIAIVASIAIDLVGALPTLKHAWQKPHEETWLAFFLAAVGAAFTLLATSKWTVTALAYPLYILVINTLQTGIIMARASYAIKGQPEEMREL